MTKTMRSATAMLAALALVAAACGGSDGDGSGDEVTEADGGTALQDDPGESGDADPVETSDATQATAPDGGDATESTESTDATESADTPAPTAGSDEGADDLVALGLWDDGGCDPALDPLVIGNISPHDSPVLSLTDHAVAVEAAAEAFNARGGANGACIVVITCDDQNSFDRALECAREMVDGGVVATVNDADSTAAAEVSAALADAGIPRVGGNVSPVDWADTNAYPISTSSAVTFLLPDALIQQGTTDIGLVRVDVPAAAAARGLFESTYADDAAFPADVPVPAGTTDYSQFVLAAENAGAEGIILALGSQEAIQVARAGQQLGTDLEIAASLGSFSYTDVVDLGEAAGRMTFVWSVPPATADLPIYEVLRADLAASGDEALQPENLKTGAMMSWISLYGLLEAIRDAGTTDLSRESVTSLLNDAEDLPMAGMFGDETWTPALDYDGAWQRVGIDRYTYWVWDPDAEWDGRSGNFVPGGEISFSDTMCGSPFGSPGPC